VVSFGTLSNDWLWHLWHDSRSLCQELFPQSIGALAIPCLVTSSSAMAVSMSPSSFELLKPGVGELALHGKRIQHLLRHQPETSKLHLVCGVPMKDADRTRVLVIPQLARDALRDQNGVTT
jgi:hypothetical protein